MNESTGEQKASSTRLPIRKYSLHCTGLLRVHRRFPFRKEGKDILRVKETKSLIMEGNLVRMTLDSGTSQFVMTEV